MISWQLSYGNPRDEGLSIVDRSVHGENVRVDGMEVFAITPVPEPDRVALLSAGPAHAGPGRLRARAARATRVGCAFPRPSSVVDPPRRTADRRPAAVVLARIR